MENTGFSTRHNVMNVASIDSFVGIKGGVNHKCKDVYFIRGIGYSQTFINDIERMDRLLATQEIHGQGKYIRISELPKLVEPNDIAFYLEKFDLWEQSGRIDISIKSTVDNSQVKNAFIDAMKNICIEFEKCSTMANESIMKNFLIKVLFWTDAVIEKIIGKWGGNETDKVVFIGKLKKQEYLFFYFLTKLGIDIMLLCPEGELEIDKNLLVLSQCIEWELKGEVQIPAYDIKDYQIKQTEVKHPNNITSLLQNEQTPTGSNVMQKTQINIRRPERDNSSKPKKAEMGFEELALLASSVVMITIHNSKGEAFATGSGIMISNKGYILTNNHVASGGYYYSVRIEDDEEIYKTDELIKYNQDLDLALIRINRSCSPIPIYTGGKSLVRGQKVVAIGSPLGLFNSVSNGIISGFRNIGDLDMIQFTAPISHGSSGGAVLNMHGEIIGISTAGIDSGQNINLAVDYRCISEFIRGFS